MPRKPSKSRALELLRRQLTAIPALEALSTSAPEFTKWSRDTQVAIEFIFRRTGSHLAEYRSVVYSPLFFAILPNDPPDKLEREFALEYAKGLAHTRDLFPQSMIEEIETFSPRN